MVKTEVSVSVSLLRELALYNRDGNITELVDHALTYYLTTLKKQERSKQDLEIINANAERFNREAEENLLFQAPL